MKEELLKAPPEHGVYTESSDSEKVVGSSGREMKVDSGAGPGLALDWWG